MKTIRTVLTVDIGTSSLKAALIDSKGNVYAYERIAFDLAQYREHSVSIWIKALSSAVPNLIAQLEKTKSSLHKENSDNKITISALCVSGNGPTIATDEYLLLWNEDITLSDDLAQKAKPSLFLPRLLYIKEQLHSVWQSTRRFFSGPEYLIYQLCGAEVTILPEKRFEKAYWTKEQLAVCNIESDLLPAFVTSGHCAGILNKEIQSYLGLQKETNYYSPESEIRVICGAPDFVVALIGTNTLTAGAACDRAGSSEGINMCTAHPLSVAGVRTLPSVLSNYYNASVLLPHSNSLEAHASIPYITDGIRTLEQASGYKIEKLRITGGQARNKELNQQKSNALGIPVEVMQLYDAELIGDAVLAFYAFGEYASIQEAAQNMVSVSEVFYPQKN